MQLLLTIKRDKRKVFCGHVFFMNQLLIEHGRSEAELKEKLSHWLFNLFEISADAIHFQIRSHHVTKALHVIGRLKRKPKEGELSVSFNSEYFI